MQIGGRQRKPTFHQHLDYVGESYGRLIREKLTNRIVILFFLITGTVLEAGHAQQNSTNGSIVSQRAAAIRTSESIQVDGALDENAWQSSRPIGEILQREPREGEPATENTEVRLLFDEANLYIGVICHNSEPEGVIATRMSRDADLSVDDRIENSC